MTLVRRSPKQESREKKEKADSSLTSVSHFSLSFRARRNGGGREKSAEERGEGKGMAKGFALQKHLPSRHPSANRREKRAFEEARQGFLFFAAQRSKKGRGKKRKEKETKSSPLFDITWNIIAYPYAGREVPYFPKER